MIKIFKNGHNDLEGQLDKLCFFVSRVRVVVGCEDDMAKLTKSGFKNELHTLRR